MRIVGNRDANLNNMERQVASVVFNINPIAAKNDRSGEDELIEVDDIILLGRIAPEAVTIDLRCLIHEAFPAGTTFDVGFPTYDPDGNVTGVVPVVTGLTLDTQYAQVVIPMPTDGNEAPDGTPYVGDRGGIWGGTEFAAQLTNGTMDGSGNVDMICTHTYFGTKSTGGYIR